MLRHYFRFEIEEASLPRCCNAVAKVVKGTTVAVNYALCHKRYAEAGVHTEEEILAPGRTPTLSLRPFRP